MSNGKVPDPGWNDPPVFTYDRATEIQNNAMKKGNLLNKRVAYPLSSGSSPLPCGIDPTTPPQMKGIDSIGTPPMVSKMPPLPPTECCIENNDIPLNALEEVMKLLRGRMTKISVEHREEITKRLDVMERSWRDKQLNLDVQKKLYELTIALKNEDFARADRLQQSLSVDHITICSSWMGGVRQLINLLREQNPTSSDL